MKKIIPIISPTVGDEEIELVKKVIKSKFITEGKITTKFENLIAKYVHSKFAIATSSGTTALHTCFECLNVKNKQVLVSDFTFPATVNAIILARGKPVLVDVDRETMNITTEIAEQSISEQTDFLAPVSLFGNPLEKSFYKFRKNGLVIVEDAATNLGTKLGSKYVGNLADVSCFSFHPRKIITTGEGGMITTSNKKFEEKFRSYKTFGKVNNEFLNDGTNYKMSDILSAIGIAQFKKLEKIITKRIEMAKIYDELISKIDIIKPQKITKNARHTFQSYTCIITKPYLRDKIRNLLTKNNIETQIGTYALHCLPYFSKCKKMGNLKNSEYLYKNTITLPLHENLTYDDQRLICKLIEQFK
jgi:dTDP-4-amino-4,6-dideoxygalactose transaminase